MSDTINPKNQPSVRVGPVQGYAPPVICVPHELMEPDHANEED